MPQGKNVRQAAQKTGSGDVLIAVCRQPVGLNIFPQVSYNDGECSFTGPIVQDTGTHPDQAKHAPFGGGVLKDPYTIRLDYGINVLAADMTVWQLLKVAPTDPHASRKNRPKSFVGVSHDIPWVTSLRKDDGTRDAPAQQRALAAAIKWAREDTKHSRAKRSFEASLQTRIPPVVLFRLRDKGNGKRGSLEMLGTFDCDESEVLAVIETEEE